MPVAGTQKLNVNLPRSMLAQIDRAMVEMRLRHGVILTRSQIIGALIDRHQTKNEPTVKRRGA